MSCWGGGPGGGGTSWGPDTRHPSSGCRPRKGQLQGDKRGQEASPLNLRHQPRGKTTEPVLYEQGGSPGPFIHSFI